MNEEIVVNERTHSIHIISKTPIYSCEGIDFHDVSSNSGWGENPNPNDYVVVPDNMVDTFNAEREDKLVISIVMNEDETELVSYTVVDNPVVPEPEEPVTPSGDVANWDDMAKAIEEGVNDV